MKEATFKDKISEGFQDLFYIWKREFQTTFRDQGVLIFFILVPLMYPLIYGFIYTNEVVREVPAIVVDDSHSSLSREFIRKVDATADVEIKAYCSNMEEAKQMMKERKAYGIIYIPSQFSDDIARGNQTKVSLYCDMSGLLYYKGILLSATAVSLDMNKNIKISRAGNTTNRQDEITAHPIDYDNVALFNPQNGFAAFLIPAVLILLIQQTLLLGIGLSAGTAREHNRFKDLVPINRHYNGTLRIVMGKGLSYFMVYSIISVYVLCVVPRIFSLNQIGQPDTLILFMLPYLAACIFFAMTASIAIRNRETCMLIFVFTSVPLLFISGISWPGAAIPAFWKYVSYIFPSTFGINGFVRINNMGATLNEVTREYQILWLQAGFYFLTTCWVYRWQIINSRKHVLNKYREMKSKEQLDTREITE
jgi:ABC-2 type transport system permease protein